MDASEILGFAVNAAFAVALIFIFVATMKEVRKDTNNQQAIEKERNVILARFAAALETYNDLTANELEKDSQK